jgi:hypothetical protein
MTEQTHPIVDLTHQDLERLLQRALRETLVLGALLAAGLWIFRGWRDAAMLAAGAAISAASILEWQRLARVINDRIEKKKTAASAWGVGIFFVLRPMVFAGVIYGSLKCFKGSPIALLCGLGMAVVTLGWEVIRVLRD